MCLRAIKLRKFVSNACQVYCLTRHHSQTRQRASFVAIAVIITLMGVVTWVSPLVSTRGTYLLNVNFNLLCLFQRSPWTNQQLKDTSDCLWQKMGKTCSWGDRERLCSQRSSTDDDRYWFNLPFAINLPFLLSVGTHYIPPHVIDTLAVLCGEPLHGLCQLNCNKLVFMSWPRKHYCTEISTDTSLYLPQPAPIKW